MLKKTDIKLYRFFVLYLILIFLSIYHAKVNNGSDEAIEFFDLMLRIDLILALN